MIKILLTNDDGIDAPGLRALRAAAEQFGDVSVYAPLHAHSGCSHRLTTDTAIHVHRRGDHDFAVDGTPGDCVRLGLHHESFDWVLSGINDGGNLGVDVFYSGTVAAVREATIHGVQAVAFSSYSKKDLPRDWDRATRWSTMVFSRLLEAPARPGSFWSVNFPHLQQDEPEPRLVLCPLDTNPLPLVYDRQENGYRDAGRYDERPRTRGSDVDICFSGNIALTRLSTCHGSDDEASIGCAPWQPASMQHP